jgi:hypothetical protein
MEQTARQDRRCPIFGGYLAVVELCAAPGKRSVGLSLVRVAHNQARMFKPSKCFRNGKLYLPTKLLGPPWIIRVLQRLDRPRHRKQDGTRTVRVGQFQDHVAEFFRL